MQIGGLAILKNRHNCVKAQRYNVRYWHHIGADLVGTIENEYIRKQYKAVSSDADGPFAIS